MKRIIVLAACLTSLTALAQMGSSSQDFMRAMTQSMKNMDRNMEAAEMNGNVDCDFAAMMIPHHQGAIDMAKAELSYGKDPVMRRMAQEILIEQQSEVDAMHLWLARTHTSTEPTRR